MIRTALVLLLAFGVAAGCANDAPPSDSTEASGEAWEARGVYLGTRFEGQSATIDHEDIPGLMDSMQMDFLLASPEAVDGLEAGDKVSFQLDYVDNRVVASGFEVLPDTTMLALASGATRSDSSAVLPDSTDD